MKECSVCHELSITLLDFNQKQSVCRQCRHPLAHLTQKQRSLHAFYTRKYGIGYEDFVRRAQAQGNLCSICRKKKKLVVDHDHKTGAIRGLLCTTCNTGIGMLKDSPAALRAAALYIERSSDSDDHTPDEPEISPAQEAHMSKVLEADHRQLQSDYAELQSEVRNLIPFKRKRDVALAIVNTAIHLVEDKRQKLTDGQAERYAKALAEMKERLLSTSEE